MRPGKSKIYMSDIPRRRNTLRCVSHDYGLTDAYFITICTEKRQNFFGNIVEGKMYLNALGKIVEEEWKKTAKMRKNIQLGEWVVMPNHFHGILFMESDLPVMRAHGNAPLRNHRSKFGPQINNLSSIIRGFKGAVKYSIKKNLKRHDFAWQRSFYDHIIRNEKDLQSCWDYILNNPIAWELDKYNPDFDYNKAKRDHKIK